MFLAVILALVLDNSSLAWLYDGLLETPMKLQIGALIIAKPLLLWINDGLMAIFFFFVALEIKRELMDGHLSDPREAALPAIAVVGGMAMPALVFVFFNWSSPEEMRGWAIPAATDIAFALGVLALLEPLPLGIALGLFVGKQLGVFGFAWIAIKTNVCRLPKGSNSKHIYGVALLTGIGFTMSLFIGTLAFDDPEHARAVRIGVLSGSIVSGVVGYLILRFAGRSSAETGTASSAA